MLWVVLGVAEHFRGLSDQVWNLETRHCCQTVVGHKGEVWTLDADPEERRVVVGSNDPEIRMYSVQSAEEAKGLLIPPRNPTPSRCCIRAAAAASLPQLPVHPSVHAPHHLSILPGSSSDFLHVLHCSHRQPL